jgi:predicted secreted protein
MSAAAGIVVYVLLWWWVFFMALPIGVKRNNNVEVGHDTGAPANTYLWIKVLATTLIALIVWFGVNALINAELFSFREMSKSM